jgi:hypothetical protein
MGRNIRMSQQYLLPCSCGQKVRVANAQAGEQVTCVCGKSLSVPTLRGLRQLELAPLEAEGKAKPGWSRVHGAIFAGGLLLAGVGIALISYYLFRYAQLGGTELAVDRSADVVSGMSAQIDQLSPVQALEMWTGEILTEGLGEAHKPYWVAAKDKLDEYVWWMKVGGAALAAGALLSVGTLFVGRPSK